MNDITFTDMQSLIDSIIETFKVNVELCELSCSEFAKMHYPKIVPVMNLDFHKYEAADFGNVSTLKTHACFGKMQLATVVFTPNCGTDVPLLLMDIMVFGKKRAVFIEYYDCTKEKKQPQSLVKIADTFKNVENYPEKPAWYINERAPYSLIKGGSDDAVLIRLIRETVASYSKVCAENRESHKENYFGLSNFINRMVDDGNPSTSTMDKILGKADAERFFRTMVMPIKT